MSPLELYKGDRLIAVHEDVAQFSRGEWANILGVSKYGLSGAIFQGGVERESVPNPRGGFPSATVISVSEFPKLIKGFQETALRGDGKHYYPWSQEVDTSASVIEVEAPSGWKLVFRASEDS